MIWHIIRTFAVVFKDGQNEETSHFDTNYIVRPQTKWTLSGRLNVSGAKITAKGDEEGRQFDSEMTADYKSTISAGPGMAAPSFCPSYFHRLYQHVTIYG